MITKKVRSLVFVITAFALTLGLALAAGINSGKIQAHAASASGLKIAVLSDTHYYPPSFIKNNEAFINQRKHEALILESAGVFESALIQIQKDAPDVLLVTGDITAHGEKQGHDDASKRLKKLQDDSGIKVLVINGNSDINSKNSIMFNTGIKSLAAATTQKEFKDFYADLGYNGATAVYEPPIGESSGGLSYATSFKGYTFLAIDTAKYSADITASGLNEQEMGGYISQSLLTWIKNQATAAQSRGEAVIAFQHHGLANPFTTNDTFADYIMTDCAAISEAYADAKIELLFSSQFHAIDIATYESAAGNKFYDVQTGSLTSYPSPYRIVDLSASGKKDITITVDVDTKYVNTVTYNNKLTSKNETIENFTEYSKAKTTMTKDSMYLGADEMARNAIADFVKKDANGVGGMETIITAEFEEQIKQMILDSVVSGLPTSKEEARDLRGGSSGSAAPLAAPASFGSAAPFGAVVPMADNPLDGLDLTNMEIIINIHIKDIVTAVKNMMLDFETKYLKDFTDLSGQLDKLITEFAQYEFAGVDDNMLAVVNAVYLGYLAGDEKSNELIQQMLDLLEADDGYAITKLIEDVLSPILSETIKMVLDNSYLDLKDLLKGGNDIGTMLLEGIFVPNSQSAMTLALLLTALPGSPTLAQVRTYIFDEFGADANGRVSIGELLRTFTGGNSDADPDDTDGDDDDDDDNGTKDMISGMISAKIYYNDALNNEHIAIILSFGGGGTTPADPDPLDPTEPTEPGESLSLEDRIMEMFLTPENLAMINTTIYDTILALSEDSNYTEDNKTSFTIAGFAKDGCGGCGTVDLSSFITMMGVVALIASLVLLLGRKQRVLQ